MPNIFHNKDLKIVTKPINGVTYKITEKVWPGNHIVLLYKSNDKPDDSLISWDRVGKDGDFSSLDDVWKYIFEGENVRYAK